MPDDQAFVFRISFPAGDFSGATAGKAALEGITASADKVAASAAQAGVETGRFTDAAGRLREANGQFVATGNSAEEAGRKIGEAGEHGAKHLSDAEHAATHLFDALKQGVGIDIGHRLVEGIAEIPAAFREALAEGVRFNQEIETLGIQLGGAMRSANPGRYLNFAEARQAGTETLEILRVKANELGTNFQALAETFAINAPLLAHAGIKGVQDQIDTIILLNQVAQAHGISGFQAQRDIIDLLNGQGSRTQLGRELESNGVTNESIKKAEEMGTLMDLLHEKLGAYGEAGRAAADTFAAGQQRLQNVTEQLYGEIAKPVFNELKDAYDQMAVEVAKPEVREALESLGYDIASVVRVGAGLVEFAVRHADVLVALGSAIGAVSFALAAYKTAQIAAVVGARLTALVTETTATEAQTLAIAAQTDAIVANTEAKAAGAGVGAVGTGAVGAGAVGLTVPVVAAGVVAAGAGIIAGAAYRAHIDGQRDEQEQKEGEAVKAQNERLNGLRDAIARAQSPEDQAKARQALTDELNKERQALEALQKAAVPGNAWQAADAGQQQAIASLKVYVDLLEAAERGSAKLAGSDPLAGDSKAKEQAQALEAYQKNSPEARLARAQASGDQDAIDKAKFDQARDKRAEHLEKTDHLSPGDAQFQAGYEISAADNQKQEEEADKKAQRDAERADVQKKRDEEQAQRDRDEAARNAKQRIDALADEQAETAILAARGRGQNDVADQLEKQRDILRETTRLQNEGVDYTEAQRLATERVNAAASASDARHMARPRAERREDDEPRHRRGERETFTIQGYSDPNQDRGGGLHTGGLTTGSLDGVGASTASAALAAAPSYVPTFPTASASIAPPAAAPAGRGADPQATTTAANDAAREASSAAAAFGDLTSAFGGITAAMRQIKEEVDTLKSQLHTHL